ncbi:hypothetical protein KA977_04025 [Candidatus Dependentiae bacterium]|nr:hypothetical protein [Candidatus Dependentiae bacterium]
MKQEYETTNLPETAFLLARGFKLKKHYCNNNIGKVFFVFENNLKVEKCRNDFLLGSKTNIQDYLKYFSFARKLAKETK